MIYVFTFTAILILVLALGFMFDLHDARLRAAFARTMRAWAASATHWEWS